MRISRLVLSGAAIGTIAGTGRADLNQDRRTATRHRLGTVLPRSRHARYRG
jgi:hypothetical protein